MGIQCDSTELLDDLNTENIIIPETKPLQTREKSIKKKHIASINIEIPKPANAETYKLNNYPSKDDLNLKSYGRVQFSKRGDWNQSYVLRVKNSTPAPVQNSSNIHNSRVFIRKTCKVTEFSPFIPSNKRKIDQNLPWGFASGEKGIFNIPDLLKSKKKTYLTK